MRARLARLALALYPLAWRRRYGDEMEALLEDSGTSPRAIADLARGAVRAHLRPEPALAGQVGRDDRIRLGVSAVLFCWVLFGAAIFAFAKTTEEASFRAAAEAHAVMGGAQLALQILAVLASVALVLGAAPLVVIALANLRDRPAVRRATLRAIACVLAFVLATGAVVLLAHGHPHVGTAGVDIALVAWAGVGLVCILGCVGVARQGLFAVPASREVLRLAAVCAAAIVVAMLGIALATAVYLLALLADAPGLAADANGPGGLLSVGASLGIVVGAMVLVAVAGSTSARRALGA